MMSTIVATCNLRCETGERGFLKTCLSSENFCLYVYMTWPSMRFEMAERNFPSQEHYLGKTPFWEAGYVRNIM